VSDDLVAASYATDEPLLAELRTAWPPGPSPLSGASIRGYVAVELAGRPPDAAMRLGDRFAVALVSEGNGWLSVPLAGFGGRWWWAAAGDGLSAFVAGVPAASERELGADQTNASVVVGERVVVKWFRRVGPEPSRAARLLAHLAEAGFDEIPRPLGSVVWRAPSGVEVTVAQGDRYLTGASDGWDWVVGRLERHVGHGQAQCPADCDPWVGTSLGRLTGRLHAALASATSVIPNPVAAAGTADVEGWRAAAERRLAETIDLAGIQAPGDAAFLARVQPAIRRDLDRIAARSQVQLQPVHGDLHVGQILEWSGGLAVIDFDGNPAFGPEANAIRQPVERDVAQLAMSLDHVGRIVERRMAGDGSQIIDEWIAANRRDLLDALDPDPDLLAAFEAEQELRELIYAARFLPRWWPAPMAALQGRYGP